MSKQMKRKSLNWIGKQQGFGGCSRCGDRWNWKEGHKLDLANGFGTFPLCEECWENTTKEEKLAYYLQQVYKYVDTPQFNFQEADANIRRQIDEYYDSSTSTVKGEKQ